MPCGRISRRGASRLQIGSRRRAAVFAGGDPGQREQLAPAEGGAGGGEFFGCRAVEFLGAERAVFRSDPGAGRPYSLAVTRVSASRWRQRKAERVEANSSDGVR